MNIIGITMGCPAGIGPEIIVRYFEQRRPDSRFRPVVLGDPGILQKCCNELDSKLRPVLWQPSLDIPEHAIPVLALSKLPSDTLEWGRPTQSTAKAMVSYIKKGVELVQNSQLDAICTCPISKDALQNAGYTWPGHTEMLADLTGSPQYAMMMAGKKLRVTLVTIHCALKEVPVLLSIHAVLKLIRLTSQSLKKDFGITSPRIAVAGLNPHSGENRLFGDEEDLLIHPAILQAKEEGIDVNGPFPPDTIFFTAAEHGNYDTIICMYHDQGLIPFKLLHFHDGVNVTLGLSIVRTSVDHGTAYDIAGKGIARCDSLMEAVQLASEISSNRKKWSTHSWQDFQIS
ncbi:4-hydroxythreonine-4-phosphate dehydrogenase PdxA [Desulfomarina sp.]